MICSLVRFIDLRRQFVELKTKILLVLLSVHIGNGKRRFHNISTSRIFPSAIYIHEDNSLAEKQVYGAPCPLIHNIAYRISFTAWHQKVDEFGEKGRAHSLKLLILFKDAELVVCL